MSDTNKEATPVPLTTPAHATGAASSSLDAVDHCVIHPGIGIARLGNSQTGFFLGPEAPGVAPAPEGGFKDGEGAIKRQGVRFRIYGYDQQGAVVAEITDADAEITWTVHLVNKKASWYKFHGRYHIDESEANLRNKDVQNTPADPNARAALIIDPGPRSISGPGVEGPEHRFDTGTFLQVPVPLGELRTDEAGRLVVLGGYGHSASTKPDNPLHHYANNDAWFDDTRTVVAEQRIHKN